MELVIVLFLIAIVVHAVTKRPAGSQSIPRASKSAAHFGEQFFSLGVDPSNRTRDVIRESIQIAAKTKRRDVAESRLEIARRMLSELESSGSVTDDDRALRDSYLAVKKEWREKPTRKTRSAASSSAATKRKAKTDGEQWLPGRIEANAEPAPATQATPRKKTPRMRLREQIKNGRAGAELLPRVQWVAVIDGLCDQKCAALHRKEWLITEQEIDRVVESHCDSRPKGCRCTLQVLPADQVA